MLSSFANFTFNSMNNNCFPIYAIHHFYFSNSRFFTLLLIILLCERGFILYSVQYEKYQIYRPPLNQSNCLYFRANDKGILFVIILFMTFFSLFQDRQLSPDLQDHEESDAVLLLLFSRQLSFHLHPGSFSCKKVFSPAKIKRKAAFPLGKIKLRINV